MPLQQYFIALLIMIAAATPLLAADGQPPDSMANFSTYLRSFNYREREEMKIKTEELIKLYQEGKVQIVDVRFSEETGLWDFSFTTRIPINELPDRLAELDKNKIIVTVCPHYDRASLARHYLALQGYRAKYLTDGLLKLAEALRGDDAREFYNQTKSIK
ncbi:MAG: rhodanese-like domain-containing protein [Deltaproteobacteria bacterium]|nr:rhodanese-like domain-containing protein [Deltaproteobacteria bacterium]